jgi:signal transduction histidine kinase|tara:strand:- start:12987 stop:13139 length:153 start_codon:yes stop_codon:yes gene_type:complete
MPGMGLGLVLTKSIVEEHGGILTVSSELGAGSTFTVVLPLGDQELQARSG